MMIDANGKITFDLHSKQTLAFESHAQEILYGGAAGGGKLANLSQSLPILSGWTTFGEVKVGDIVFNSKGEQTPVIAISEIELNPDAYEITFDTGEKVQCDARHLWVTMTDKEREAFHRRSPEFKINRKANRPSRALANPIKKSSQANITKSNREREHKYLDRPTGTVRTTEEIFLSQRVRGRANHSIEVAKPLQLPERKLELDPYTFGMWLGDGYSSAGQIGMLESDINELLKFIPYNVRSFRVDTKGTHIQPFKNVVFDDLQNKLKRAGVFKNKHIPIEYLRSSFEQRLELLRGILDTDGHCDKRGQIELGLSNKRLADDCLELISSLGIKATQRVKKTTHKDCYRVKFVSEYLLFRLPRKAARQKRSGFHQSVSRRYIVDVSKIPPVPMRCIQVGSPCGTFLIGKSMIPTHNSHLARVAAIYWCTAIPRFQFYLFRRLFPDLIKNHVEGANGFRAMLQHWVDKKLVVITEEEIRFWNGSKIYLCHCQYEHDRFKYLGAEMHMLCLEEATQFTEVMYRFLRSRVRATGLNIPPELRQLVPRILLTSNPGNIGHHWVKAMFVDSVPYEVRKMPPVEGGMTRQYIPARLDDNPSLLFDDPGYEDKLSGLGSAAYVRAMRDGDWSVVAGAFFTEWNTKHVIRPFKIPDHWVKFQSFDWGYARPFSCHWIAVCDGDMGGKEHTPAPYPKGSLIVYREWYGCSTPNTGLRMTISEVAHGILDRELENEVRYRVADPAIFKEDGGPSIADTMRDKTNDRVIFIRGDNSRIAGANRFRELLKGDGGVPKLYFVDCCVHAIRTIPALQHDEFKMEDIDTDGEDHCLAGDTLVVTDKGKVKIRDLVGSSGKVLSWDGEYHNYQNCRLTRKKAHVVKVTMKSGKEIICTPDHKFLTINGWVMAVDLKDVLLFHVIKTVEQETCVSVENLTEKVDTYCLTVPTLAAFVIADNICVSNCYDDLRYGLMSRPYEDPLERPPECVDGLEVMTWNKLMELRSEENSKLEW